MSWCAATSNRRRSRAPLCIDFDLKHSRRIQRSTSCAHLASRHRWPHWVFWALVGVVTINIYWLTIGARRNPGIYQFHLDFSSAMYFINRVWIAAMACSFFLEARRNGALELILTTPIEVRTLRRGPPEYAILLLREGAVSSHPRPHWNATRAPAHPRAKPPGQPALFRPE